MMPFLHVIMTHVAPAKVADFLAYCEHITPGVPRLIAYGGPAENFPLIEFPAKIFLADESLRGPVSHQCFNEMLPKVSDYLNSASLPDCRFIHLSEFDHPIFQRNYFDQLADVFARSGCDFIGKTAGPKAHSNWPHYIRYRENEPLLNYLNRISKREDKQALYGSLLNGMTFSRQVLESLVHAPELPHVYTEILFPTLAHHLGFKVGDIGAFSDMFRHVRWGPNWKLEEIKTMIEKGVACCHPFKDLDQLPTILRLVQAKN